MKTIQLFLILALSGVLLYQQELRAQTAKTTVRMGINFNAQTCWQNNFSNVCSIGIPQEPVKDIKLEAIYNGCTQQPQPFPVEPPNATPDQPTPVDQCEPRNWRGHWIDLLYTEGKRYVGIVTIEKSLISMSSLPQTDRTWYTVTVEILDMKKTVAKMNTGFESWAQIPYATLESMPIENGNSTTTITLTIDQGFELIIAPNPSPIATPVPIYSPTPSPSASFAPFSLDMKNSSRSLPKAQWNIIKGQLIPAKK